MSAMETIYDKNRRPIAKKSTEGKYTYLKECTGRNIAIYDSSRNQTFDCNRKFACNGNILDSFIPYKR